MSSQMFKLVQIMYGKRWSKFGQVSQKHLPSEVANVCFSWIPEVLQFWHFCFLSGNKASLGSRPLINLICCIQYRSKVARQPKTDTSRTLPAHSTTVLTNSFAWGPKPPWLSSYSYSELPRTTSIYGGLLTWTAHPPHQYPTSISTPEQYTLEYTHTYTVGCTTCNLT